MQSSGRALYSSPSWQPATHSSSIGSSALLGQKHPCFVKSPYWYPPALSAFGLSRSPAASCSRWCVSGSA
jgi:hypothetical protein